MAHHDHDPDYDLVAICDNHKKTYRIRIFNRYGAKVLQKTNEASQAESAHVAMYKTVNHALELLASENHMLRTSESQVALCVANDVVLKQLTGETKVSDEALKPLRERFLKLKKDFGFVWVTAPAETDPMIAAKHDEALAAHQED